VESGFEFLENERRFGPHAFSERTLGDLADDC
jgi:hypothetical protein